VIQISKKKRKDVKVCGEVSMFEFAKQNDRQNTMKYFASMLLSVTVHAAVLCMIVTVPLIFCNTLHPGDVLTWMLAPPQQAPVLPTAPSYSSSPGSGNGAGKGHAASVVAPFTAPLQTPVGVVIGPPTDDIFVPGMPGGTGDGGGGGDRDGVIGGPSPVAHLLSKEKIQTPEPPAPPEKKVKIVPSVPSIIQGAKLIYKVVPVYPELARRAHVSGTVILTALIDEEGNVVDLSIQSGNILLTDAAVQAVKQWKYSPTILNGEPVSVRANVNVIFSLQ
jgi:protein TonB